MKVLCSFPGKFGDIAWALPTIRALSWRIGEPVDLIVAKEFRSICPLIAQQPYIGRCEFLPFWTTENTAPISPRVPQAFPYDLYFDRPDNPERYDAIFHLGYRGWPQRPLPFETLDCLNAQTPGVPGFRGRQINDTELALDEPWIHVEPWTEVPHPVVVGWSDEHFELKYGVSMLALSNLPAPGSAFFCCAPGSRWQTEAGLEPTDWLEIAARMKAGKVFLGCCSALHVLACAVGMPVICMEPNPQRHNSVFYPFGTTGRVRLVTGGDGQPTFDARHVKDTVQEALSVAAH